MIMSIFVHQITAITKHKRNEATMFVNKNGKIVYYTDNDYRSLNDGILSIVTNYILMTAYEKHINDMAECDDKEILIHMLPRDKEVLYDESISVLCHYNVTYPIDDMIDKAVLIPYVEGDRIIALRDEIMKKIDEEDLYL